MSGFYVTLPSNSSMNIFKNNTQSSFSTQLQETLKFTSPHEVALVEMNYTPSITTDLGEIVLRDYYKNIYEFKNNPIIIPISIMKPISIEKLILLMNRKLEQTIYADEIMYRSASVYLSTPLTDLDNHWFINKLKKDNNVSTLEVFKCIDKDSKYIILDREDSVFAEQFLQINPKSYNKDLNKWQFDNKEIKELNKFFHLSVFLCLARIEKYRNINLNNDKFKNIIIDKVEKFIADRSKDKFNILEDLNLTGTLPQNTTVIILKKNTEIKLDENDTIDFIKRHKLPELELVHNDDNKVIVKINYENDDEFKYLYMLRGKLSNFFFEQNFGSFTVNTLYYVNQTISTINYAILYTDIIEDQYFGDTKTPILKIIPIKTQSDNEVVTFFDNLHYVPLKNNYINSIRMDIKDIYGDNIKFENKFSFVVIKIHIRKIQNE